MKKKLQMTALLLLTSVTMAFGQQVGIGTDSPDASAILELDVSDYAANNKKGFLPPRMTTAQRDAIASPAEGLTIYNTSVKCIEFHNGSFESGAPVWISKCEASASVFDLTCGSISHAGTLTQNTAASGVSATLPYVNGNGSSYAQVTASSTGVTGLTATLSAGTFANGSGNLVFNITGTATTSGQANFSVTVNGKTCSFSRTVAPANNLLLTCGSSTITGGSGIETGKIAIGINNNDRTLNIPYTNGGSGGYSAATFNSTGVTGLTATLAAGTLNSGSGTLSLAISGTPTQVGLAAFSVTINGKNCSIEVPVLCARDNGYISYSGQDAVKICGQIWMRKDLGATNNPATTGDLNISMHGDYYAFGNKTKAFSPGQTPIPTYPYSNDPLAWNSGTEQNPVKTSNDPCPTGYRIPTSLEYTTLVNNTDVERRGVFGTVVGYNSGWVTYKPALDAFPKGESSVKLTFPISGYSWNSGGAMSAHGNFGTYYTSRKAEYDQTYRLGASETFYNVYAASAFIDRASPIRCIKQ